MTNPDQLRDLIQVRVAAFASLKAKDGTLGIMMSFWRTPSPRPDVPVQIALTIPQAEDLLTKLHVMISDAKDGRKPHPIAN